MSTRDVYIHLSGCDASQYLLLEGVPVGMLATLARIQKTSEVRAGGCVPGFRFATSEEEAKEKLYLYEDDEVMKIDLAGKTWLRRYRYDYEDEGEEGIYWTEYQGEEDDEG